jgi:hypothetical protein
VTIYPNSSALYIAGLVKTALAGSKLKLYTAIANPLGPGTVIADFTEADFDGYALITITNFLAAYLDPAGGASIQSGTQQFNYGPAGTPPVGNTVLGFWLTNAAGALVVAGNFDTPITMNAVGDSIPVNITLNYGA